MQSQYWVKLTDLRLNTPSMVIETHHSGIKKKKVSTYFVLKNYSFICFTIYICNTNCKDKRFLLRIHVRSFLLSLWCLITWPARMFIPIYFQNWDLFFLKNVIKTATTFVFLTLRIPWNILKQGQSDDYMWIYENG